MPCPNCRRVRLDNLGQAVICTHAGDTLAFFRCKACDHRFQMPVRTVGAKKEKRR